MKVIENSIQIVLFPNLRTHTNISKHATSVFFGRLVTDTKHIGAEPTIVHREKK